VVYVSRQKLNSIEDRYIDEAMLCGVIRERAR